MGSGLFGSVTCLLLDLGFGFCISGYFGLLGLFVVLGICILFWLLFNDFGILDFDLVF